MTTRQIVKIGMGLGAIALFAGFSDTPNFKIKPGLWENTVIVKMNGAMPQIPENALDQMTPEQRQRIEAAMQAQQAAMGKPRIVKTCITQDMIDHGFRADDAKTNQCKTTILTNTATTMELHQECAIGNGSNSVNLHYEAVTPETFNGTIHVETVRPGASNIVSDATVQGRWIASSCGDVK